MNESVIGGFGDLVIGKIREAGIIPVIRAESADAALDIADALVEGGVTILEVTMTVPNALDVMAALSRRLGASVVLGAGTVRSPAIADAAIEAGCRFLVTPALLPEVVAAGVSRGTPIICGALTPTEIFNAHRAGADLVKVFPASAVGGPAYLRALKGPFPDIDLVPTGGVTLESVPEYFKAGAAAVGVGGELISRTAVASRDFEAVRRAARQFVDAVGRARADARSPR